MIVLTSVWRILWEEGKARMVAKRPIKGTFQ